MAVRIGKFGMSWLQPAGQAADLLVEAGRAKGAGLAALGQGIGQGIQAFGQNRRAERVREQDLALREQSRQDALAERAADNARQDAEFSMRQDAWKVEVLTANRDKAAQEAQMLATAAQELGDPDIVQRAKAAESEAQRFGTALDTLLSSRMGVAKQGAAPVRGGGDVGGVQVGGKPMSQMTDAELNDLMGKSERGEVDYTYRGGATGDMGQGVGTNAPSAAPMPSASMVNDGGVMSGGAPAAPMASAPSMPQVDPRDPYVLMETAQARMKAADEKLRGGKLDARGTNLYQRMRLDAAAQYGFAQSLMKQQKDQKDAQDEAAYAGRLNADAKAAGYKGEPFQTKDAALKWLEANKQISVAKTKDEEITDPNKALAFQRAKEMQQIRNTNSLGRMAQAEETKKRLMDYAASSGKADDPRFKMLSTMRDDAVNSARSLYAAADNDSINKTAAAALMQRADAEMARVKEFDKQMAMVFEGATAPKTVAPAPSAGPAPATGEATAERLKRLWNR